LTATYQGGSSSKTRSCTAITLVEFVDVHMKFRNVLRDVTRKYLVISPRSLEKN
jgi:hypothetical protein